MKKRKKKHSEHPRRVETFWTDTVVGCRYRTKYCSSDTKVRIGLDQAIFFLLCLMQHVFCFFAFVTGLFRCKKHDI